MSKRFVVVDTNILILASQGRFDLLKLYGRYAEVLISVVSKAEALGFNFINFAEEVALLDYLRDLVVQPFTEVEAEFVIAYRKARRKIAFPDAAILATARAAGADLLTQNLRDFQDLDPAVSILSLADL